MSFYVAVVAVFTDCSNVQKSHAVCIPLCGTTQKYETDLNVINTVS